MRHIIALGLAAGLAAALVAEPPGASADADPFAGLPGRAITPAEARTIDGGDVYMTLNPERTKLTVKVYDNEYEASLGRLGPKESYTVDAHNRIQDTTSAPFMPAGQDSKTYAGVGGLTTRPGEFPEGCWNITNVREEKGKYGPNMISTDAVGRVQVYSGASKVAEANDRGYAIHSNTNSFDSSVSHGCVVVRQEDNNRIAKTLRDDAADYSSRGGLGGALKQVFAVFSRRR